MIRLFKHYVPYAVLLLGAGRCRAADARRRRSAGSSARIRSAWLVDADRPPVCRSCSTFAAALQIVAGRGRRLWRRHRSCRCASPRRGWRSRSRSACSSCRCSSSWCPALTLLAVEPALCDGDRDRAAGRGARAARPARWAARRSSGGSSCSAPAHAPRGSARSRDKPGVNFVVAGYVAMGEADPVVMPDAVAARRHPQSRRARRRPRRERGRAGAGGTPQRAAAARICCGSRPPACRSARSRPSSNARRAGST